jgi:hypothetical protein
MELCFSVVPQMVCRTGVGDEIRGLLNAISFSDGKLVMVLRRCSPLVH